MEYISMLSNIKIISAISACIMNTDKFKILNRKCSFLIQLNKKVFLLMAHFLKMGYEYYSKL